MKKGRIVFVLLVLTLSISGLAYRLYNLQIVQHERYSAAAFRQRSRMTEIYRERGQILDRNMISFTGRNTEYAAVLQPAVFTSDTDERKWVADILETDIDEFINFSQYNAEPRVYTIGEQQAETLAQRNIKGVSVIETRKRTEPEMPAAHLIGYTDDSGTFGLAGLEKVYQDILTSQSIVYVQATTDANHKFLDEYGYRLQRVYGESPLSIKLTLDYHMQKLAEEVMDKMVVSGAVVIIDILSGDILVLASRPGFNPEDVSAYLNDEAQPLFNRAIAGYTPGSIFKVITAAAALENNFNTAQTFECPGFVTIGDQVFRCWIFNEGSHGTMDLKNGFAQSCNSFFIHLGIYLGSEKMIETAKEFGLGSVTGINSQRVSEYPGLLPKPAELENDGSIANLAIGQGKILITPLQAASIAATIANGGIRNSVNLVDCIVNKNGDIIRDLKKKEWKRVISRDTANKLMEMMSATVNIGTGYRADIGGYGGSAGKTGSAETGMFEDGKMIIHAWFTGFFPYVEPRYAMCVFVEDGTGGGTSAAPVFAEIASRIMEWEEIR